MIGAIAGDMIGSRYERYPIRTKNFDILVSAFTDDTVLTVAVSPEFSIIDSFALSLKMFAFMYLFTI